MVAFGLVAATLIILILGGDEGVRQLQTLASSAGRLFVVMGQFLFTILQGVVSIGLSLLRGVWTVLEVAAPLIQGAAMVAAAAGLMSIIVSLYHLALAYRRAPLIADMGSTHSTGGIR